MRREIAKTNFPPTPVPAAIESARAEREGESPTSVKCGIMWIRMAPSAM
jgi:hypothetical protein